MWGRSLQGRTSVSALDRLKDQGGHRGPPLQKPRISCVLRRSTGGGKKGESCERGVLGSMGVEPAFHQDELARSHWWSWEHALDPLLDFWRCCPQPPFYPGE